MFLVGLSLPQIPERAWETLSSAGFVAGHKVDAALLLCLHVLAVTLLMNLGKMFAAFCYRNEASWSERAALGVAMFPRGEVGGGVLVISLAYGINATAVAIATLALAVNLIATGLFILAVRGLLGLSLQGEREKSPTIR
jgi:Kef-type K+ transport system membrane component KefB